MTTIKNVIEKNKTKENALALIAEDIGGKNTQV